MNADRFVEFLDGLRCDVAGPVFLVVDDSSIHKAAVVKEYVEFIDGCLRLFFIPGYSPKLNPDKWVLKSVKVDTIGKAMVKGVNW